MKKGRFLDESVLFFSYLLTSKQVGKPIRLGLIKGIKFICFHLNLAADELKSPLTYNPISFNNLSACPHLSIIKSM